MDFWVASTVLLWVVVLLNLLLTVGLIRRVNATAAAPGPPLPPGLPAGTELPHVTVRPLDGDDVALTSVAAGPSVLLFLSPSCEGCRDQLPAVREVVGAAPGVRAVALVATADPGEAAAYRDELPGATVVMAAGGGADALGVLQVHSFPMYYTVDAGSRIAASAFTPAQLSDAVASLDPAPAS